MGAEILLVNPRKRRSKKRRSAAQKAATRKLVARNRRKRNPSPPGSRRKTVKRRARRAAAPARRRSRRRSNPVVSRRNITALATAAASGAAGAIALDVVLAYLPLPAVLKTGITGKIAKAAGAIALGVVAKKSGFVRDSTARDMTVGALTVQFTGIGRDLLGQFAPGIALSAYMNEDYENSLGYAGSGWNPTDALSWKGGMNAYNVGEDYDIAAPGDGQPGMNEYESEAAFGW